ncbi:MAG TPA: CopD family protein [Thermoanaerobaculia bacterium]
MYRIILLIHVLGATIWTGGHLVLALRILPVVLRERSAAMLLGFEQRFEALGMTALVMQVVTGLWLAQHLVPVSMWFTLGNPISRMLAIKWTCLILTIAFALDARFRVLPRLRDDNVQTMVPHITAVTTFSVLFVFAGVGIRTGGWS